MAIDSNRKLSLSMMTEAIYVSVDLLVLPRLSSGPAGRLGLSGAWQLLPIGVLSSAHRRHSLVADMAGVPMVLLLSHVLVLHAVIVLPGNAPMHPLVHRRALQPLLWHRIVPARVNPC